MKNIETNSMNNRNKLDGELISGIRTSELQQLVNMKKIHPETNSFSKNIYRSRKYPNVAVVVEKPRKSVKQMVDEYEDNIILPPPQR